MSNNRKEEIVRFYLNMKLNRNFHLIKNEKEQTLLIGFILEEYNFLKRTEYSNNIICSNCKYGYNSEKKYIRSSRIKGINKNIEKYLEEILIIILQTHKKEKVDLNNNVIEISTIDINNNKYVFLFKEDENIYLNKEEDIYACNYNFINISNIIYLDKDKKIIPLSSIIINKAKRIEIYEGLVTNFDNKEIGSFIELNLDEYKVLNFSNLIYKKSNNCLLKKETLLNKLELKEDSNIFFLEQINNYIKYLYKHNIKRYHLFNQKLKLFYENKILCNKELNPFFDSDCSLGLQIKNNNDNELKKEYFIINSENNFLIQKINKLICFNEKKELKIELDKEKVLIHNGGLFYKINLRDFNRNWYPNHFYFLKKLRNKNNNIILYPYYLGNVSNIGGICWQNSLGSFLKREDITKIYFDKVFLSFINSVFNLDLPLLNKEIKEENLKQYVNRNYLINKDLNFINKLEDDSKLYLYNGSNDNKNLHIINSKLKDNYILKFIEIRKGIKYYIKLGYIKEEDIEKDIINDNEIIFKELNLL